MNQFNHIPVMLDECIQGLDIKPNGIYVDCTLGGGGHSEQIAKRLTTGKLIVFDKDYDAIKSSKVRLKDYEDKIVYIHDDFKNAMAYLDDCGYDKIDGVLMDLGVSSYQIDEAERGFSYCNDAPLDMRMDQSQYLSAFNVVNEYNEIDLANIIYEYGEERLSRKIAYNIVKFRQNESIRTTGQLAQIVEKSFPPKDRWKGGNPCKRTFQAIRIEVNGELKNLDTIIKNLTLRLTEGGRICVITFHSLEDRIVKRTMQELEKKCICPPTHPICNCNKRQDVQILTKKPLEATKEELDNNSRSSCAKLRIAIRK